ncbi:MAG: exodeoxyribonuclease VII large subunit [Lachnospiraceae bacterium]|nr:exodeoxyribonuclease VII large subunit [Lachnospiraceae bacterium]
MAASVYTVKQLNCYIKNMFEQDFLLSQVAVQGEISNLKDHPTGHIYFSLKDEDSVIGAVMFAGQRKGLKCRLQEGMKVVVRGSISVYEARGSYQIYAKEIEEAGVGDLYRKFLELKEKLGDMGMFDEAYKKPLPQYAMTVGIVTAQSGAALQDICQIAARRNPYVQLVLSPALVQGNGAPESLVRAIERMDAFRPDVMIVGRGGGSIEDLWAFNDERVARAIFDCETPVISAVGHEVDFTIADFVADHRAPTPSAAAELAVFEYRAFEEQLASYADAMEQNVSNRLLRAKNRLERAHRTLMGSHPQNRLERQKNRLFEAQRALLEAVTKKSEGLRHRLALLGEKLDSRSPLNRLSGGYGYLSKDGKPVGSVKDIRTGDLLRVKVKDGSFDTEVIRTVEHE